jgi:hypothetical protein
MPDKELRFSLSFPAGDRTGMQVAQQLAQQSETIKNNWNDLDSASKRHVANLEANFKSLRRKEPWERADHRRHQEKVRSLERESRVNRDLAQRESDRRRKARLENRAAAQEAAAGFYNLPGQIPAPGAAGVGPGGMRPGFFGAYGRGPAGFGRMLIGARAPTGPPRPIGERIGESVRRGRMAVSRMGMAGMGLIGLFEITNLLNTAMQQFEERARGMMRVGAMMGTGFARGGPLGNLMGAMRGGFGYLTNETLGAAAAAMPLMSIAGGGPGMVPGVGAGIFARGFGLDLARTSATMATFERFTRGALLGGATGEIAIERRIKAESLKEARDRARAEAGAKFEPPAGFLGAPETYARDIEEWGGEYKRRRIISKSARVGYGYRRWGPKLGWKGVGITAVGPMAERKWAAYRATMAEEGTGRARRYIEALTEEREAHRTLRAIRRDKDRAEAIEAERAGAMSAAARRAVPRGARTAVFRGATEYESLLIRGFSHGFMDPALGRAPHLAGPFLEAAAGVSKAFAGRGGVADPANIVALLAQLGGPAFAGIPGGIGIEPTRAADMLSRFAAGTATMGDPLAYTMKVRALTAAPGPLGVGLVHKRGRTAIDPRNPYNLRLLMEEGINNPEILRRYIAEAKRYGPGLSRRALVAMTGGAVSEKEAMALLEGKFKSPEAFLRYRAEFDYADPAKAAMRSAGGRIARTEAGIEGSLEGVGGKLDNLRRDVRSGLATIANAVGGKGLDGTMKAVLSVMLEHKNLLGAFLAFKALGADSPVDMAALGAAAGLTLNVDSIIEAYKGMMK